MKTLTLDLKKWRCGANGQNQLGAGRTRLLNKEGFMCCLGQFSLQLGATELDILDWGKPSSAGLSIPELNDNLSYDAIGINDNERLTTEQRIAELKELFSKHGFEIKVINQ